MWSSLEEMDKDVRVQLDDAWQHCRFTIDKELQVSHIAILTDLLGRVDVYKERAKEQNDEQQANGAFIAMKFVTAIRCFLELWVAIKDDRLEDAWEALVCSQSAIECGLRFSYTEGFVQVGRLLHALEMTLFPPQKFTSISHDYGSSKCSICGQEYGSSSFYERRA